MRSNLTDRRDSFVLTDGRRLAYRETGPRGGIPVFYCHGAIGTPLGPSVDLDSITRDLRIRHVAVSRPGIGGSDPAAGRTISGFAADLRQLADGLRIPQFAVVGYPPAARTRWRSPARCPPA